MGSSEKIALFIHHGGRFEEILYANCYIGGNYVIRADLDPDCFGYFDVKDLVEKIVFVSWKKLWYQIPQSNSFRVIRSDKEVMDMLAFLSMKIRTLHIYVEGGKRELDGAEEKNVATCNGGLYNVNLGTNDEAVYDNYVEEGVWGCGKVDVTDFNDEEGRDSDGEGRACDEDVGNNEVSGGSNEEDSDYDPPENESSNDSLDVDDLASGNEECWTWFLKCLCYDLGITNGAGWTFISDQQKGLENAVSNLAPAAEHRNCARHIYMNWKKQHSGQTLKNIFWRAVKSTYKKEYKMALEEMKAESVSAFQDFIARDVSKFYKAFLSVNTCSDMIDNNISETFNDFILNVRSKHVIHMLEEIRTSLMVRQVQKVAELAKVSDRICPNIRKKLEHLRISSRNYVAYPALGEKFEIHNEGDRFVIDMKSRSCTCRVWQLIGIPCIHAICAIQFMHEDASNYVNDYYNVRRVLEAYWFGLEPLNGEKMWPEVKGFKVLPPPTRKMPGRPKKKRRRHLRRRIPKILID